MGKRIHWAFDGTLAWEGLSSTSTKTALSAATMNFLDGDTTQGSFLNLNSSHDRFIFNFPGSVQIDKVGIRSYDSGRNFSLEISNDSTDGFDGTWTEVLSLSGYTTGGVMQFYSPTATSALWLRINVSGNSLRAYNIQLFGEYDSPRFEFWNTAGTAELTAEYPLAMANAPNLDDYAGTAQFKLKNTDSVQHDYSLTIKAVRYGGDTTISDNYTLSTDGGSTKLATVTISALAAGSLSGVIDVYGDVLKANNPADGYHYFVVDLTETA